MTAFYSHDDIAFGESTGRMLRQLRALIARIAIAASCAPGGSSKAEPSLAKEREELLNIQSLSVYKICGNSLD